MPILITIEIRQCQEMAGRGVFVEEYKIQGLIIFLMGDSIVFCILVRLICTKEKIDDAREGWDNC